MPGAIFVDTNVLVYARDAVRPDKQGRAMEWLERAWRDQSGRTSLQVVNEFYVTLTRRLRPGMRPDDAWDDCDALLAWDPQPVDRELTLRAREIESRYGLGWWDSLVVAAAQLQECELLLTEELQDGMRFGLVEVVSPFRMQAKEAPARYVPDTGLARRHRPPGRPRKRPATATR
jgi:predicted nucleic acid-binding protein